jgi:hypothetical protein
VAEGAAIGAICTGLAAVGTAWAAVIRAKKVGTKECEEELKTTRKEAEEANSELHKYRMKNDET